MRICLDLDGTICGLKADGVEYADLTPLDGAVETIQKLHAEGHYIIIQTARNMKLYNGNIGLITANQVPVIVDWLKRYNIPFDELFVGKPFADAYIDDNAIKFENWSHIRTTLMPTPL